MPSPEKPIYTMLSILLLTYVLASYIVGVALFVHELPRNPRSLVPFGILLLVLSPFTAPSGINFYYKEYKTAKEKLSKTPGADQE